LNPSDCESQAPIKNRIKGERIQKDDRTSRKSKRYSKRNVKSKGAGRGISWVCFSKTGWGAGDKGFSVGPSVKRRNGYLSGKKIDGPSQGAYCGKDGAPKREEKPNLFLYLEKEMGGRGEDLSGEGRYLEIKEGLSSGGESSLRKEGHFIGGNRLMYYLIFELKKEHNATIEGGQWPCFKGRRDGLKKGA